MKATMKRTKVMFCFLICMVALLGCTSGRSLINEGEDNNGSVTASFNTNTYTNATYGFSIDYPTNWTSISQVDADVLVGYQSEIATDQLRIGRPRDLDASAFNLTGTLIYNNLKSQGYDVVKESVKVGNLDGWLVHFPLTTQGVTAYTFMYLLHFDNQFIHIVYGTLDKTNAIGSELIQTFKLR